MKKGYIFECPCYGFSSYADAKEKIGKIILNSGGYSVAINAEKIIKYKKDLHLKKVIDESILSIPDGVGAVWGLSLLNNIKSIKLDLPGIIFELANEHSLKLYLLGGVEESNKKAAEALKSGFKNIIIAGRNNGYYSNIETIKIDIKKHCPDIVLLAMGSPKQEFIASELVKDFPNIFFIGCGGRFDILSGIVKRAPKFWQKLNLEWLYRLLQNPSRYKRQLAVPKLASILLYEFTKRQLQKLI